MGSSIEGGLPGFRHRLSGLLAESRDRAGLVSRPLWEVRAELAEARAQYTEQMTEYAQRIRDMRTRAAGGTGWLLDDPGDDGVMEFAPADDDEPRTQQRPPAQGQQPPAQGDARHRAGEDEDLSDETWLY